MRVAFLTGDFFPAVGGISAHVRQLAMSLREAGADIEIWHRLEPRQHIAPSEFAGDVPVRTWPALPSSLERRVALSGLHAAKQVRHQSAHWRPDIIHVHTLAPLSLAARLARTGATLVLTNHSSGYLMALDRFGGHIKMRAYAGGFHGVIAPSQELLERSAPIATTSFLQAYIPNGVDLSQFSHLDRRRAREELSLQGDAFIVLSTRRFVAKNGLRFLAEGFASFCQDHPAAHLLVCGEPVGEEFAAFRGRVAPVSEQVTVAGAVSNTEIETYYAAANVVVVPSLIEATSISALEAMAAGRPVIASNVGGLAELIQSGRNGFLVPDADGPAIGQALRKAAATDLEIMEQDCRRSARPYSWPRIASKTLDFYNELLRQRTVRHRPVGLPKDHDMGRAR